MDTQEIVDAVKEQVKHLTQFGQTHMHFCVSEIDDTAKGQLEHEGLKLELVHLIVQNKRTALYKISW